MGLLMRHLRLPPMLNQAMMMAMCVLLLLWHLDIDMEGLMWHTAVTTAVAGLVAVALLVVGLARLVLMVVGLVLMVLMQTVEAALVGVVLMQTVEAVLMVVVENMGCNSCISSVVSDANSDL